jgi:hypothetical protein
MVEGGVNPLLLPFEGEKMTLKEKNKARPEVKITLDKERTLRFDLNAMVAFEDATGKSLMDGTFDSAMMSIRDLRAMLWACLLHEDDALTEKNVGSLIIPDNMLDVAAKLNEAFEVAMPESEGKEAPPLAKTPQSG